MRRLIISAETAERHYWADLWQYRELFFFLSWRDILVRYKQTVIGILWAVIKPLLAMIIFTVIFGKIAKMPSEGMPYPVFAYVAMLPWQFFASALTEASNSLVSSANMISKIYFPRLIIPAGSVIVCFVDFLISTVVLAGLLLWYRDSPTWRVLLLPAFTLLAFLASFGISLWLSALNVKYRDFRYVIPFIVQFGMYASPVPYSSATVSHNFGAFAGELYALNPMVGVINGFRWALGSDLPLDTYSLLMSGLVATLLLFSGIKYFRSTENAFADVI